MQLLLSNDDGIFAPGLTTLVTELAKIARVTVVAPDRARSASGHSITLHKPLRAEPVKLEGAAEAYSCSGTPTDCVALALRHLTREKPSMVISGINHGANLGWDLTYSGTVSAAMEGALLGVPAMAVSLTTRDRKAEFGCAAQIARTIIERLVSWPLPPFTLLNVNVPWLQDANPPGIRITRQGKRRYDGGVLERKDPHGRPYYWLGGEIPEEELTEGVDTRAIIDGYVSVTPLHLDLTAVELLSPLQDLGLEAFEARD